MFFQNELQARLGTKQRNPDVIHRKSQCIGNLSITLFLVVPSVYQVPIAFGQFSHRRLQHSNPVPIAAHLRLLASQPFHDRLHCQDSCTALAIIPREVACNGAQIRSEASCSSPWPEPTVSVLPYMKQEPLIHFVHIMGVQVRLAAQYRSNEATVGIDELLQRASVSRQQTCNKPHFVVEVHRSLHTAME